MFLLKDTTQWRRWGSNPRPFSLESNTLPLSHRTPAKLCGFSLPLKIYFAMENNADPDEMPHLVLTVSQLSIYFPVNNG